MRYPRGAQKIVHLVMILSFFLVNNSARSEQKGELPRSYGPLVLGMSVEAFRTITGAEPLSCVECAKGELEASLYSSKEEAKLFRGTYFVSKVAKLEYQPSNLLPASIACLFYKGKLYSIQMFEIKANSQDVITGYETTLGPPNRRGKADMGDQVLFWESSDTMLKLICSIVPSGNPFVQIEYYDLDIKKQMPPRPTIK